MLETPVILWIFSAFGGAMFGYGVGMAVNGDKSARWLAVAGAIIVLTFGAIAINL